MTRRDWKKDQTRFLVAHAETGIGPEEWCKQEGIKFSSGKRYIKIAGRKTANSQKEIELKKPEKSPQKNPEKVTQVIASETQEETFNPDDFGLTGQQAKFAENVAVGKSLVDSYRLAGYKSEGNAAYVTASQLLRNPKVARAIRWLRDRRQKRLALTEAEIIHQLSSIASADPNLISQIRRVNCRYCWGEKQGNRIHSTEGARTVTEKLWLS